MRRLLTALLRHACRRWPFTRGSGWLLRASLLATGGRSVRVPIGRGAFVDGSLEDWLTVWLFMGWHDRDAPFQRSLECVAAADVAFDVGAHVGAWSLLAVRRNPGVRVHAFEPVPETARRLSEHIALNGAAGIIANAVAVGAAEGARPFFAVERQNTGAASFYARRPDQREVRVPVVTLDAYVERERLGRVDVVKVDVEGAEMLVFQGATRLLASDDAPIVFFELNDDLCAAGRVTGREVKQRLIDHGYGIYRWRRPRFRPVAVEEVHHGEDLFALKTRHLAALERA